MSGNVVVKQSEESSPEQKSAENEVGQEQEQEWESQSPCQRVASFDQEDGFIGQPPLMYRQLSLTDAMDVNNRRYFAMAHAKSIREIGRILAEIGDQLETDYELKWKSEFKEERNRGLFETSMEKFRNVRNTVDTVFEYLEYMGHRMLEDVKTYEGVLRGILNFSGK